MEQVLEQKYKFNTDRLMYISIGLKDDKQHFVTGYISTSDIDLYNDLITEKAMKSMLRQIYESNITIDYEHESFRDDSSILPVGKIVEAKIDKKGLWVKAILNSNSPKFNNLWGSIKDGFINAFSIAFQPLKTVEKSIGDSKIRLIEDLKLLNVALTGVPVNQGAVLTDSGFKAIMLKAISNLDNGVIKLTEDKQMVEETQTTETPEVKEEPKEEVVEEKTEEVTEKEEPKEEPKEETKEVKESVEEKAIAELKASIEKLAEENAVLKNDFKELSNKAVFKSLTPEQTPIVEEKTTNMLSLIQ